MSNAVTFDQLAAQIKAIHQTAQLCRWLSFALRGQEKSATLSHCLETDSITAAKQADCGVIIEFKDDKFTHKHFGQLNAYVAYYKENEMHPGDNPPIGILLCTKKGPKMVEYALSGMDNQLFVSTYMLQLPDKEQLREFLLKQMEAMGI